MKKISFALILGMLISGCDATSSNQDTQMLQKKYETVYRVDISNYVTIDTSGNVYHIRVGYNGATESIVKIK